MVSNLVLFCLETYLATFQKIGQFFPNYLVTLADMDLPVRLRLKMTMKNRKWKKIPKIVLLIKTI
jgi:hypothetical protein